MKFSYVNFLRMIQKVVLRQNGTPYFEHPALAYAVDHNYIIGNYVTRSEALGLYIRGYNYQRSLGEDRAPV